MIFLDKRKDGIVDMRHPSITGVGGFATEDGSWGVGAYLNLFLDFYGLSEDSPLNDAPISYELTGYGGMPGGVYALGKSSLGAGLDDVLGHSEVDVTLPAPVPPEIGEFTASATRGGLIVLGFLPLGRNLYFGTKGEGSASTDDAPF